MLMFGFTVRLSMSLLPLTAVSVAGARSLPDVWGGLAGKGCGLFWMHGMLWFLRTTASFWNVPKKYGSCGGLFSFLLKKEPAIHEKMMVSKRCGGGWPSPWKRVSNVENLVLCSLAHHACSPLLQGFLHEEELCKVALTCHFSLDVAGNPLSVEEFDEKSKGTEDTVAVGGGVARMTAAGSGSRSSDMDGDFLPYEVEGRLKDTEEEQTSLDQVKALPQKRRAVARAASTETQDYVSAPP